MRYVSTRGAAPALAFDEVLLAGLARDGGLYVPETWPSLTPADLRGLAGLDYASLATRVMLPFIGGTIDEDDFAEIVAQSYAGFDHVAVAPLKQLDERTWLMELFHGPDFATGGLVVAAGLLGGIGAAYLLGIGPARKAPGVAVKPPGPRSPSSRTALHSPCAA